MKITISRSEQETKEAAKSLAKDFQGGVIALVGDLGSGKTTFAQGFAQGLGIKDKIISPTFVLIRQHKIQNSKKILFHIDLYRLEKLKDLKEIGLEELSKDKDNIILIEWAEKAKKILPKDTVWINLKKLNQDTRKITTL